MTGMEMYRFLWVSRVKEMPRLPWVAYGSATGNDSVAPTKLKVVVALRYTSKHQIGWRQFHMIVQEPSSSNGDEQVFA